MADAGSFIETAILLDMLEGNPEAAQAKLRTMLPNELAQFASVVEDLADEIDTAEKFVNEGGAKK